MESAEWMKLAKGDTQQLTLMALIRTR
jgi:hypothetical protein